MRGDFDGDGKNDLAVFHDASGLWFIKYSSTGAVATIGYGGTGYLPVPENYDGDGMTDLAVYHPPTGLWFVRSSLNGGTTSELGRRTHPHRGPGSPGQRGPPRVSLGGCWSASRRHTCR